jgi:glycosyltransferase involved in cell wall biosynthesis
MASDTPLGVTVPDHTVPRLSVVIPTRDRHTALAACLTLLAPGAQTLDAANYEVVVADDGNAAATRPFLSEQFPWVRHVDGPGRGPAANRNAGARGSRGEWFVFADDDTQPGREWLAAIVDASAGVDVVEGRTTCLAGVRSPREHAPVNETGGWWWSCNLAVRRDVFARLGGFDERFRVAHMEDVDLRERARKLGVTSRFAPHATVDHPPRRERWGTGWAPVHQAELVFAELHRRPLALVRALTSTARVRARSVARAPVSRDGISAAVSALVELVYVVWKWGDWKANARAVAMTPR